MKKKTVLIATLVAVPFVIGARACSDCQKQTAIAEAICAQDPASEPCRQAEAVADGACKPDQEPTPEPTPTPTPKPDCKVTGCPEGQQCADLETFPVQHRCIPKPAPIPTPTPTPTPAPACGSEQDLVANEVQTPAQLHDKVADAMEALGDPRGKPPAETLARLAAKLVDGGLCSFAGVEAVFVRRAAGQLFEEYHPVYFGDGGWTNSGRGKYIGVHRRKTDAPPPPEPESACPAPRPSRDPKHLKIKLKPHGRDLDGTIVTVSTCGYCNAIGMGDVVGGTITRCGCPMRNEGSAERVACELYAAGGEPAWQTQPAGREVIRHDGNPWQARCVACERMRLCVVDMTVCSEWVDAP